MYYFKYVQDDAKHERWLETNLCGRAILNNPVLNKGTAFSDDERDTFELNGQLPLCVETLEQQVARAYAQYNRYQTDLSRNIYLNNLRDRNETVFYTLLSQHIAEMMPMIYTPIVGTAVKEYSKEFRSPRGLYISYKDRNNIRSLLQNRPHAEVDLLVVTDGGGVLGIGDQGIGAMDIPVAKLMVYTLFGGIHPSRSLPIMLDVGTNNQTLLNDPMYLGWRHERISDAEYNAFIEEFVDAVTTEFPRSFLHWEDLGQINAQNVLQNYKNKICTFNDDIQGTGAVVIAALMAAVKGLKSNFSEQRIVVFGAGTAGMGITDQIYDMMVAKGLTEQEAKDRIWILDRPGLLTADMTEITPAQSRFLRKVEECASWQRDETGAIDLLEVVKQVKPTILIGSSAVTGAFNQEIVQTMANHCARPIIFPLSNPTERSEAHPSQLLEWTNGEAIIATGSPFMGVAWKEESKEVPQSNNALVFPGIGLGVLASQSKLLTDSMIHAAADALSEMAPINKDPYQPVLPPLSSARHVSVEIAKAVVHQAEKEGLTQTDNGEPLSDNSVENTRWIPEYLPIKRV